MISNDIIESDSVRHPYKGEIVWTEKATYDRMHTNTQMKYTFGLNGDKWEYLESVYRISSASDKSTIMPNFVQGGGPYPELRPLFLIPEKQ